MASSCQTPFNDLGGKTRANFEWLVEHALALCREYTARYGKFHKSEEILYRCADLRDWIPAGS